MRYSAITKLLCSPGQPGRLPLTLSTNALAPVRHPAKNFLSLPHEPHARLAYRGCRPDETGRALPVCHGAVVDEELWDAYDSMGVHFRQHAADSAYNAHYDRPAVLAALGPVTGRQVLDAACGPGLYLQELLERGAEVTAFDASPVMVSLARRTRAGLLALSTAATDAGFLIEKVIEPVPAETMRENYPDDFEKLSKEPGFLILRLVKPAR
jgi:SAM-dependent methyltransferase